uniref:Immunoglobulin V-set domain-containing protein n=1 Tax=Scleropages formosus TaxID=113540 RepID=A0A8C9TNG3_SCLFO
EGRRGHTQDGTPVCRKNYVKQWCSGLEIFSCTVMASTDSPQVHRVSIIDDPTQGVFTVTMNNVQESDSGTYWCLGKYGGWNELDDPYYITVTGKNSPHTAVHLWRGLIISDHCIYVYIIHLPDSFLQIHLVTDTKFRPEDKLSYGKNLHMNLTK